MIRDPNIPEIKREFAAAPSSWYFVCTVAELARKPVRFDLPDGQTFVAFRAPGKPATVISGRCSHMGADLSRGCVKNGRIACPLHGWEYGRDGSCERIPASAEIPAFARQQSFPVEERCGLVFFFNRPEARFPMPFFEGVRESDLLAARPFAFDVKAPWFIVGGNGFDVQHFRNAHDRTLVGEPIIENPHPFCFRLRAKFEVTGASIRDSLTRWISGRQVEMTIESWCGNLVLVTARFRRTTTFGLVSFMPLGNGEARLRDIVLIRRSANAIARLLFDPLDAMLRRLFIREFVRSDVEASAGVGYRSERAISADKTLVEYLDWLHNIHR